MYYRNPGPICVCGTPFEWYSEEAGKIQGQTIYVGNYRPCQNCGAIVPPFSVPPWKWDKIYPSRYIADLDLMPKRERISPMEFAKAIGASEIHYGGGGSAKPTCIICDEVVEKECEQHPGRDNIEYRPHSWRRNPYRRNADANIRDLERQWSQGDHEAGLRLQAWKRRLDPITVDVSTFPSLDRVYMYNADLFCEDCGKTIKAELLTEMQELDDSGYAHQLPEVSCNNQLCNYRAAITQAIVDEDGDYVCGENCNWQDVRIDEYGFDSDQFPKGPNQHGYSDSPKHCGSNAQCLNAIQIDWKIGGEPSLIGGLLGGALTDDGIAYVMEAIQEGRPVPSRVADLWGEYYRSNYPEIDEAVEREEEYRNSGGYDH